MGYAHFFLLAVSFQTKLTLFKHFPTKFLTILPEKTILVAAFSWAFVKATPRSLYHE